MLYEIAGTGTRILGTLHFFPPGQQRWIDPVRRIFDWAEKIYIETKVEKAGELVRLPARFKPGHLSSDLRQEVDRVWPHAALGDIDRCSLLGVCLVVNSIGLSRVEGVEPTVRAWLGSSGDVLELETAEDFVHAANDIPLDDLIFSIRFALQQRFEAQRDFEAKARAWRVHDLAKLEALTKVGTTEAMRRALFETRNRKWAAIIARAAKSPERTLVLCGAGHLCGPNNLREVLERDHGHAVNRLMM